MNEQQQKEEALKNYMQASKSIYKNRIKKIIIIIVIILISIGFMNILIKSTILRYLKDIHFSSYFDVDVNNYKLNASTTIKSKSNLPFLVSKEEEFYETSNHMIPTYNHELKNIITLHVQAYTCYKNILFLKLKTNCSSFPENNKMQDMKEIKYNNLKIYLLTDYDHNLARNSSYIFRQYNNSKKIYDNAFIEDLTPYIKEDGIYKIVIYAEQKNKHFETVVYFEKKGNYINLN